MFRRLQKWLWNVQGLTCQEATRLAARAMDRPPTLAERFRLLLHSLLCVYCRNYARQLRWMRKWARRLATRNDRFPGSGLPTASASRLRKKLEDELPRGR